MTIHGMDMVKFLCIDTDIRKLVEYGLFKLPELVELARERGIELVFTSDRSIVEFTDSFYNAIGKPFTLSPDVVPECVMRFGNRIAVFIDKPDLELVFHSLGHVYLSLNGFEMMTVESTLDLRNPEAATAVYVLYDICLDALVDTYCTKRLREEYLRYVEASLARAKSKYLSVATLAKYPAAIYRGVMTASTKIFSYLLGRLVEKHVKEIMDVVYDKADKLRNIHDVYALIREVYLKIVVPEIDRELRQTFGTRVVYADARLEDLENGVINLVLQLEPAVFRLGVG